MTEMKFEDFVTKRKEYDAAQEGEEYDNYYEENEEFCALIDEVMNIEETLDDEYICITTPNDFAIELDDAANKQIRDTLSQLKIRKIEEF